LHFFHLALALFLFNAYRAPDIQRKKDALLINTIFFALSALMNIRCYSPLVGTFFHLIAGEGRIFLWKALFDAAVALWSFMAHSGIHYVAVRKTAAASQ